MTIAERTEQLVAWSWRNWPDTDEPRVRRNCAALIRKRGLDK